MKNKGYLHSFVICAYEKSEYLEDCIQSVLVQSVKSEVLITTSTPNAYIYDLAKKYDIPVIVNPKRKGIGCDFDFAVSAAKTPLVTVAHQDDVYFFDFTKNVLKAARKDMLICFTDYREGRADGTLFPVNRNLRIKKIMLLPMRSKILSRNTFMKKLILSFGNPISCPTVTFYKKKIMMPLFDCDMKSNIDWFAWSKLAKVSGRFVYIPKELMMHRVHKDATTTILIGQNKRKGEDLLMLLSFWPKPIAKFINHFYNKAEESVSKL